MSQILQAGGLSGGRQGVMKEKIVDVKILRDYINPEYLDAEVIEDKINTLIEEGYQPMPNSFSCEGNMGCILMMKTEMKVEMI